MIYLYNDSDVPVWNVVDKNEKFFRVHVMPKEGEKRTFGIDIVKRDHSMDDFFLEVLEDDLAKAKNKALWALGEMCFTLCYNSKTGLPFVKPTKLINQSQLDLYVLAYTIPAGMKMVNTKSSRFSILYTEMDEEAGMVYIIGVAKAVAKPFLYLTFANDTNVVTKHLLIVKATNEAAVFTHKYTVEEAVASKYADTIYSKSEFTGIKPSKVHVPYALIIYPFDMENVKKDICEARYNKSDKFTVYIDANAKDIKNKIMAMTTSGYSAATYYINETYAKVTEEMMNACPYVKSFRRVNYICSDGKIKSL